MGKKVPLRIGRKSKRELNPVEKLRKKEKQKKNLKQFISKMNKKASGEFTSKVKKKRSPSPETNDPMVGELISPSSLRSIQPKDHNIEEKDTETDQISIPEPLKAPSALVPVSLSYKTKNLELKSESESSSEEENNIFHIKPPPVSQNQSLYKTLIESDSKLTDFFTSIQDLM